MENLDLLGAFVCCLSVWVPANVPSNSELANQESNRHGVSDRDESPGERSGSLQLYQVARLTMKWPLNPIARRKLRKIPGRKNAYWRQRCGAKQRNQIRIQPGVPVGPNIIKNIEKKGKEKTETCVSTRIR
jgi:hypothetical protein